MKLLKVGNAFNIVSDSLIFCSKKYETKILGYVLMPNHIHFIAYFKKSQDRIGFMRDFKKFTSTMIRKEVEKFHPTLLQKLIYGEKGQIYKVWQERFDETYLITKEVLEKKLDYIHNNPLQEHWQLVAEPADYFHSSAAFYEKEKQPPIEISHYKDYF